MRYLAVWGNGRTGVEAGILSSHETHQEAVNAAALWLLQQDNPAVGAWVRDTFEDDARESEAWRAAGGEPVPR